MWPASFQDRLHHWVYLRQRCQSLEVKTALLEINDWWFQAPWQAYYLHWDDQKTWPDPWDLLADNVFCSLARALGIMYTIILVKHEKIHEVKLIQTPDDNLVLVDQGKYILNWAPNKMLNIGSADITIKKTINSSELQEQLR